LKKPKIPRLLAGGDWVFNPPCQQALEAADGAPLQACDAARADANFAQLCVLYVAMTRAQQAMVLIVPKKAKNPTTVSEADLLRERLQSDADPSAGPGGLTPLYACGDPDWCPAAPSPAPHAQENPAAPVRIGFTADIRVERTSKEHPTATRFSPVAVQCRGRRRARLRFCQSTAFSRRSSGLEEPTWTVSTPNGGKRSSESATLLGDVERQFRACLKKGEIRNALSSPSTARTGTTEVWREAPFNLLVKSNGHKQLMSGRFDRLVVERDAAGRPVRATIIDFKSNRIASDQQVLEAARGYAGQMRDYALPPRSCSAYLASA
jgi:ATP-dependent helicase/nuclease subunit A